MFFIWSSDKTTQNFSKGVKNGASAVAAANIFHHIEHSTILAKASLLRDKVDIRLDSDATYQHRDFDDNGRLLMMNSKQLDKIEFKKNKYRFLWNIVNVVYTLKIIHMV